MKNIEESRIGIFVCHCGFNIGGVVDIPTVVNYAKTLPDVVCAEENLYTCSSTGLSLIKDCIKKYGLNRVVVASCTPASHEPLFRSTCEEAGLNKYLFEMVNIREHSSWVHMKYPREATEKAKDLIRMAVAKARHLQPREEIELEINPSALVVGGGISGITAAVSLARQGFEIHLVEMEVELGGMLRDLHKLQPTGRDASKVLQEAVAAVKSNSNIHLHMSTRVKEVDGFIGNFNVTLQKGESRDDLEQLKVGTIIVATGAESFKPVGKHGYRDYENVVTQLELEQLLKSKELGEHRHVVMIQCVGSREKTGRTYCSRICCMVALNNALLLKKLYPESEVTILFRDLQTYGDYEDCYREARAKFINFIRYDEDKPPQVISKPDAGLVVRVFDTYLGMDVELDSDLVVLSTPLVQHEAGRELSPALKVPLGTDGFFFEAHPKLRPVDFTSDGIFVCGTAHGPKDITESIAQA
ncbi:FAD-dependent oxidoreductase, partial [Candidatus Bathyarchaeota archaeon]|nr:FAD-dependent oxidoreductase [Candidatus Bathyarchaeota archaeon]